MFPISSVLFEATNVLAGYSNLKTINMGNVEQAKALKLNLDSSRKNTHLRVSCWIGEMCIYLFVSFFS